MRPGALYVMVSGQDLMHKWPADSWDIQQVVCMYVGIYVCMYVGMYVCMYVGMYVCRYIHMYVCM